MEYPPYCPNPKCRMHDPDEARKRGRFIRHGTKAIQRYPFVSQRFRCGLCRKTTSISFFGLSYRDRRNGEDYEIIFRDRHKGASKLHIARERKCAPDTVLRKIRKMSRFALLRMGKDLEHGSIRESVAYDGLENFSYSQHEPNNINHAIGRDSLYLYDFNFCHLNRKGRKSEEQKAAAKIIERKHGKFPAN